MHIAYLCQSRYLSLHFMRGWFNAFQALGYKTHHLPIDAEICNRAIQENPIDVIFAFSDEGLVNLPWREIEQRQIPLIIGALPHNPWSMSFDPHTPLMPKAEIDFIANLSRVVIWSQHQPEYNELFYRSYQDMGKRVLFLPHCADITNLPSINLQDMLDFDMLFIGSLAHKKRGNLAIFKELIDIVKNRNNQTSKRLAIYGDDAWQSLLGVNAKIISDPEKIKNLYQRAVICPNVHSYLQRKRQILLNDRTFQICAWRGFQICDNSLAYRFFYEDEIVVAANKREFCEAFDYYLEHPQQRLAYIEKGFNRVYQDHSYFNRWAAILQDLKWDLPIIYHGQIKTAFELLPYHGQSNGHTGNTNGVSAKVEFPGGSTHRAKRQSGFRVWFLIWLFCETRIYYWGRRLFFAIRHRRNWPKKGHAGQSR